MSRDRELERWLLGEADAQLAAQVRERVRRDEGVRAVYDDYFAVLRGLASGDALDEGADSLPSCAEEQAWLSEDFFANWPHGPSPWRARVLRWARWPRPLALATAAVALLLAVWFTGRANRGETAGTRLALGPDSELGLVARGRGRGAELEVELFCGHVPRPVNDGRCGVDEALSFAARATAQPSAESSATATGRRALTLFGVDERGEVKYYAPTPAHLEGIEVSGQAWQAVDFSVALATHHRPGRLRVYALLAGRAATLPEIDRWAAALAGDLATAPTQDWISALEQLDASSVEALCPHAEACEAVQSELLLTSPPTSPPTSP